MEKRLITSDEQWANLINGWNDRELDSIHDPEVPPTSYPCIVVYQVVSRMRGGHYITTEIIHPDDFSE